MSIPAVLRLQKGRLFIHLTLFFFFLFSFPHLILSSPLILTSSHPLQRTLCELVSSSSSLLYLLLSSSRASLNFQATSFFNLLSFLSLLPPTTTLALTLSLSPVINMVYLTPSFMVLLAAVFSLPEGANTAALPAGRRSSMVEMDGRDVNPSFKPFQGNIAPGQHNVAFPVAKPLIDSRSAAIQLQSTGSSSSSSDSDSSSADSDSTGPKSQSFKSRPSSSDDDEMDMDIGDSSVSADVDPGMDWVSFIDDFTVDRRLLPSLSTSCHRTNLFSSSISILIPFSSILSGRR